MRSAKNIPMLLLRATASCRAVVAGSGPRSACHRVLTQACHAVLPAVGARGGGIRSLGTATQTEVSLLFSWVRLLASGHSESHRSDAAEFAGGPTRRSLQCLACRDIAYRNGGSSVNPLVPRALSTCFHDLVVQPPQQQVMPTTPAPTAPIAASRGSLRASVAGDKAVAIDMLRELTRTGGE
jgi:hypothetical protein